MNTYKFLFILFSTYYLSCNVSFAQHDYSSTIQFNVPVGGTVTNSGGLEVRGYLASQKRISIPQATLSDEPPKYLKKTSFMFNITVTNTGKNNIIISDWHFQASCPENVHGQQWQSSSFIPLITPIIPKSSNVLLKPGERKSFNTNETDFFWCLPKHETALTTSPCGFTALIVCQQIGSPVYTNGLTNGFSEYHCTIHDYDALLVADQAEMQRTSGSSELKDTDASKKQSALDPELLAMIDEYTQAQASGNTADANAYKKDILEVAGHAYPDRMNEIKALLATSPVRSEPSVTTPPIKTKTITTDLNSDYSEWSTIKNPYYSMQVRYKLEKQTGTINYYKAQFRIDFEDESRCQEARCLGYAICFGYPDVEETNYTYLHYKFFYSYKQIYTLPELLPMKTILPNGCKRMLKKDGFYQTNKSNEEIYISYFDKSVDLMLQGSPLHFKNFIESKSLILK